MVKMVKVNPGIRDTAGAAELADMICEAHAINELLETAVNTNFECKEIHSMPTPISVQPWTSFGRP